mgnify:FL=1
MITLITVKRKKQLEWCEKSLLAELVRIEQLHHALNESEAECGREREYSASLRNKVKQLEAVIVRGKRHTARIRDKADKANAKAKQYADEVQALKEKVKLLEKSQHDLIEAAKLHNIIENDPLKVVGGGYK